MVAAPISLVLLGASPARAYRPFDSTDAAVVDRGEVEIEIGPAGFVNEDGADLLVAPDLVVNMGIWEDWEVVVEGRGLLPLDRETEERRYRLVDTGLFAKGVLRRGSLQGATGPSVAMEIGMLLATLHDESGVGAEGVGIISHRFSHLTAHLNGTVAFTRSDTWELGVGLILEGPTHFDLRPVAEATLFREVGEATAVSGLLGAIWEPRDDLAFDLGLRYARDDGTDVGELRLGLTWSFGGGGSR